MHIIHTFSLSLSLSLSLQAHSSGRGEMEEEEEQHLMKTFEEIQYLIEDIDNANSKTHNNSTITGHSPKRGSVALYHATFRSHTPRVSVFTSRVWLHD